MNEQRLKIRLKGLLQGIGFRPFVYRLAHAHSLSGWVRNEADDVVLEVEGETAPLHAFVTALHEVPGCGQLTELIQDTIPPTHQQGFSLAPSLNTLQATAYVCPDIAVCEACVTELFSPDNRRYLHPFISCCHCGPRYSLITNLPYDRCHTTMQNFPLCARCEAEYTDPSNRRFHAQTIACPDCGPSLSFCDASGTQLHTRNNAIKAAVSALQAGHIVAVKGIGGFQLLVDATNPAAVAKLRARKHRPAKPFAVMVCNLNQAENLCELSDSERQALRSAAAPIVLAKAKPDIGLAGQVAPGQALLGIMLPYSPLHHLLMAALKVPVIATSGNQHDEPICIDNAQAFDRLAGIADTFLVHDRAILRPLDDSILRVIADTPTVFRRARGYVPMPITLKHPMPATLAVGGHTKNTVAIARQNHVILSQHLGDLHVLATVEQHAQTVADLSQLYGFKAGRVVCDTHPDYASSQYAARLNLPVQTVQHHYAHILSCMAEHGLEPPVLGVAWDGTGLGTDNNLWGGEFLQIEETGFKRIAHCRTFFLPGGTQAIKEPRRAALGLLYAWQGEALFTPEFAPLLAAFSASELNLLRGLMGKKINSPETTSIGRLFDAFASLLGLCQRIEFEGQAAMALEQCALSHTGQALPYPVTFTGDEPIVLDWQAMLEGVLADLNTLSTAGIAARIHQTLAKSVFMLAGKAQATRLVLSGGCFQNACLVEAIVNAPEAADYALFRHSTVPPNDGGLALGQIYAVAGADLSDL